MKKYKKEHEQTTKTIQSRLSLLVLLGAQKMVQQALEAEVTEYLGRQRYERQMKETEKHYRNGLARERRLTAGCGSFGVRVPRLREQYTSAIVDRYQRLTPQVTALIPQLYMHGLASGDFQQCFHALLGSEAPLSESSILQQKQQLESEYQAWKKRPLEREYLYVWADGVADLWKALRDVFPTARRQRCWVHKMRNVLDKVPLTVHDEVLQALREIYHASDEKTARSLVQAFATRYRHRYPKAVACLEESLNVLFSYFYFPRKHWKSIKSTNVIESLFSAVKLRTDAARRIPKRESALYLVFKLLLNQQQRLRKIHGYRLVQRTIELAQQTKSPNLRIAA